MRAMPGVRSLVLSTNAPPVSCAIIVKRDVGRGVGRANGALDAKTGRIECIERYVRAIRVSGRGAGTDRDGCRRANPYVSSPSENRMMRLPAGQVRE